MAPPGLSLQSSVKLASWQGLGQFEKMEDWGKEALEEGELFFINLKINNFSFISLFRT